MESCPWVLLEVSMRRRFHEKTGHGFDGIAKEILTIVSQYRKISCYLEYSWNTFFYSIVHYLNKIFAT